MAEFAAKSAKQKQGRARKQHKERALRSFAPTAIPTEMRRAIPPGGRPLPQGPRTMMESRFGVDFSRVIIHTDTPAKDFATGQDANAYTVGDHIVFDQNRFSPYSAQGQHLLAHELAHVVQQRRGGGATSELVEPALERQADNAADAAVTGSGVQVAVSGGAAAGVMCDRSGRKKRNGYDDEEDFESDDDSEHARRKADKERTQQEKYDRRTAGKSHRQIGSDEAEGKLRKMGEHADKPGGNQRSHKRRTKKQKQFERNLEKARGSQLDKNKRQGDFDERQRTPQGAAAQKDYVAGSPVLPGQQVRDEDDNSIAHHTRPDFTALRRRKDGTWERVHFNLKSNKVDRMSEQEARAAAREILYQAVKNKAHLPGNERLIISFAHTPSKEVQEAIKHELFREHTPISEIRFGDSVHRNAEYNPPEGRQPLDVSAKDRRKRLAAEAKAAKRKKAAEARAAKRKKAAEAREAKRQKAADARAAKRKKAADARAAKRKKAADARAAKRRKAADARAAKRKQEADARAAKRKQEAEARAAKRKHEAAEREAKRKQAAEAREAKRKQAAEARDAKRKQAAEAREAKRKQRVEAQDEKPRGEAGQKKQVPSKGKKKAGGKAAAKQPTKPKATPRKTGKTTKKEEAPRIRVAPQVRIAPQIRVADFEAEAKRNAEAEREMQAEHEADEALSKPKLARTPPKQPANRRQAPQEPAPPEKKPEPAKQPVAPPSQKKPAQKKPSQPPPTPPKVPNKQPVAPQGKQATKTRVVPPPTQKRAPVTQPPKPQIQKPPAPQPKPQATQNVPPNAAPKAPMTTPRRPPGAAPKWGGNAQRSRFLNDQVQVTVQEQIGAPKPFRVITTITLRGGAGIGGEVSKGDTGGSANASASGSLSVSYSKWMTEQDKNLYLESISKGHGGGYAESTLIELVAQGKHEAAAEAIKRAKEKMGTRQQGEVGDTEEIAAEGDVSAGAGVSRGGPRGGVGGSVQVSSGQGIRVSRTLMPDGKELYAVVLVERSGLGVGGTLQYSGVGGGHHEQRDETKRVEMSFLLDPNSGDYEARKGDILRAKTGEALRNIARDHPKLLYGSGKSEDKSRSGTTSFSVFGFGIDIDQGGFYGEGEYEDPNGKVRTVHGGASLGGSLTAGGKRINPSSKTDSFQGWVDENNVGGGVTQSENREVDWNKTAGGLADAASHPVASAIAVSQGKPILQDRVDTTGVNLTDDSYTRISKLAEDPKAWMDAWNKRGVSHGAAEEWEATRIAVRDAKGDRYKIEQALAKWEKGDSGRSSDVERLTGETGVAFDFPDEIAHEKPVYDQLMMTDILAGPRQLAADGKRTEAVAELEYLSKRLWSLLQSIQTYAGKSTEPAKFAEMQKRISARRTVVRQEINRLTPKPSHGTTVPEEPVAAPPPDFVGPLSPAQEEAVKEERKEASETIHTQVGICLSNREVENKAFAAVEDELDDFYIDRVFIFTKLNELKPMYKTWDDAIALLKAAYPKIGDPATRADQFAPNRGRWNDLNSKALK